MTKTLCIGVALALGVAAVANGLFMLALPEAWYFAVPGVTDTGPFNQHFVRDIGLIFLFIGPAFLIGAASPRYRIVLWAAPTAWLWGHALFHFWEVAVGICGPSVLARDFPAVTLPALIGTALTFWAIAEGRAADAAMRRRSIPDRDRQGQPARRRPMGAGAVHSPTFDGAKGMKLYYHPGACSLSSQIALREARRPFEAIDVDLQSKVTAAGENYSAINPKGYVPALELDDGELITENLAVLDYIATENPLLGLDGRLGRTRLIESLTYISTELHKSFKPFCTSGSMWPDKANAAFYITKRMQYLAGTLRGDYLFGDRPTVADFYLFVTLRWAAEFGVETPERLLGLRARLEARPAVQAALAAEGLR